VDARRAVEDQVAEPHADDLRDAGACVVHGRQQGSVPLAGPALRVRGVEDGLHVVARQEPEHGLVEALHQV